MLQLNQPSSHLMNTGNTGNSTGNAQWKLLIYDDFCRDVISPLLRLADLREEYNNGQPEKIGTESRNFQRYLDRVDKLKTDLARAESDVNSLKRELDRLGPPR